MIDIKSYASFFETLDKTTKLEYYKIYFDSNSTFKDPFHEVKGVDNIYEIFQKMYKNLDFPSFKVKEIISDKNISYIKWQFTFKFKNEKKTESFEGLSRVEFNESGNGKVKSHEDFWDAGENIYEKLPFIKHLIRVVKRAIKA